MESTYDCGCVSEDHLERTERKIATMVIILTFFQGGGGAIDSFQRV